MTDVADTRAAALDTVRAEMIRGSGWMVGMRWSMRAIGLLSTLALARLLAPEDFGLVAMAMMLVGFLEVLAAANFDLALIGTADATREHYDSAWTLQVANGVVLALVIVAAAPAAAAYFGDPRVVSLAQLLAVRTAVAGCSNIGIVEFRKHLHFGREFRFYTTLKLVTSGTAVLLAALMRNYWALGIGFVVGALTEVILSYAMHPYRPRFSVARTREIWSFSQWMVVFHIGTFVRTKLDQFFVGGFAGAGLVGAYHVAAEVSTIPTNEVVMPLGRALFPGYAQLADDPSAAAAGFLEVLAVLSLACFGIGVGLSVVAPDLVVLALGPKWETAVPLVRWLAMFGAFSGLAHCAGIFLIATGGARRSATLSWVHVAALAAALLAVRDTRGIEGVAAVRTVVAGVLFVLTLHAVTRASAVTTRDLGRILWRPTLASVAMAGVLSALHLQAAHIAPAPRLAADVLVGAATYVVVIGVLWKLAGGPAGVEPKLFARAARIVARAAGAPAAQRGGVSRTK